MRRGHNANAVPVQSQCSTSTTRRQCQDSSRSNVGRPPLLTSRRSRATPRSAPTESSAEPIPQRPARELSDSRNSSAEGKTSRTLDGGLVNPVVTQLGGNMRLLYWTSLRGSRMRAGPASSTGARRRQSNQLSGTTASSTAKRSAGGNAAPRWPHTKLLTAPPGQKSGRCLEAEQLVF